MQGIRHQNVQVFAIACVIEGFCAMAVSQNAYVMNIRSIIIDFHYHNFAGRHLMVIKCVII